MAKRKVMPSPRTRRKRLLTAALLGEDGRYWYQKAEREIRVVANAWDIPYIAVAAAVSATSVATPVITLTKKPGTTRFRGGGGGSNIGKARRIVKAWSRGNRAETIMHPNSPGFSVIRNFQDAWEATNDPAKAMLLAFPNPHDTKTHAFVRNLVGDPNAVTVDGHIGRGAGIPLGAKGRPVITKKRYREVVQDIRVIAKRLGWAPREVMAAAWTGFGGSGDLSLATYAETRVKARKKNPRRNGRWRWNRR